MKSNDKLKQIHPLDVLIEEVGDAEEQPPLPEGGIPRQWLPSWIRWPLKILAWPWILLDLHAQRFAAKCVRTPYIQEGGCKQRGNCCHYIMMEKGWGIIGWLFTAWHTQVIGFYKRSPEVHSYEGKQIYVMGCRHLRKDGSCGQYKFRPLVCRKWPVIEHFGHPRILKGCGFKAVPRSPPPPK
jgi:hypothetical protein